MRYRPLVVALVLLAAWMCGACAYAQDVAPAGFALTDLEKQHLRDLRVIRVCVDPHFPPFEEIDDSGRHAGISADFMAEFSAYLQVPIVLQPTDDWAQSLQFAEQRKCDIVSMLNRTDERERYLNFTSPYFSEDTVIIARDDAGYLDSMERLRGKTVGLVPGYRLVGALQKQYPGINIVPVASVDEALRRVSKGEIFATMEAMRSTLPRIQQLGLSNLTIVGRTPFPNAYRVGVRKDDLLLLSSMEKAVSALPPAKAGAILERGFKIPIVRDVDYTPLWGALSIAALVIAFLVYRWRQARKYEALMRSKNLELERMSQTDHLTRVSNRQKADSDIRAECARAARHGREFSLAMLDVDHFKRINDDFGHPVGDQALVALCGVVAANIRKGDAFGRWGGEEFVLLCPETNLGQAAALAEKLRARIEAHDFGGDFRMTCSIGVVQFKHDESNDSLVQRADAALYQAKHLGRNRVHVAE